MNNPSAHSRFLRRHMPGHRRLATRRLSILMATTRAFCRQLLHLCGVMVVLFGPSLVGCAGTETTPPRRDAGATGNGTATRVTDAASARPDATHGREICNNGLDDDGNGLVDDGCDCTPGATERCFVGAPAKAGVGSCTFGTQTCSAKGSGDVQVAGWTACEGQGTSTPEVCNGLDDDCDGKTDDITQPCSSACGSGTRTCTNGVWSACPARMPTAEVCNGIDDDCDGKVDGITQSCSSACGTGTETCTNGTWSACSARTPTKEICNGVDDDCDGKVDGITQSCSSACGTGTETCTNGTWSACSARTPTKEICNGVDDDCDGKIDGIIQSCSTACGTGTETCTNAAWSTCSAKQPSPEVCNGIDDDCNGTIDDGLSATWTFTNYCTASEIFIVFGGCNVCEETCTGTWIPAGGSHSISVAQNTCFEVSAFARTPSGDVCLVDANNGSYEGAVHTRCNGGCHPQVETNGVATGC